MSLVLKLSKLLTKNQLKQFWFLQFLVIFTALFESLSVVAVAPLMSAITDPQSISNNKAFVFFTNFFGDTNVNNFIFHYSMFFLFILFVANMFSIITIWLLSKFAARFGAELSDRLYILYSSMNYLKFLSLGSAYITKQVSSEVSRLTDNVLQPIVQINARIFSGALICVLLFLYSPFAAFLSLSVFSIAYLIIYFFVKKELNNNGKKLSNINQSRFRFISEGFGAFREIKSFEASKVFSERFSKSSNDFSKSYSTLNTIYNAPRYIIEFFVFSTLVFLILKYNSVNSNIEFLSVISVFGLAALKLLPIFQQIYSCVAQIRGHKNSLDLIYRDITDDTFLSDVNIINLTSDKLYKSNTPFILELQDISFQYSNQKNVIKNLNISFKKGLKVAIVGKSGAGKSTLSDIVTGLLLPTNGRIVLHGEEINSTNLHKLRNHISIVPQSPFIIQGSFINNVSLSFQTIKCLDRINFVLEQVGLLDYIKTLSDGVDSIIGDGNIQLSGGQKQRLAIARALYKDSDIIFFDEPTSSLDPESETDIVTLVNSLAPDKTIITITHRLTTIKDYDKILILHEGNIQEEGVYSQLLIDSNLFNKIMTTNN
jgi:ABC-type multidrug transport system fused ATPase/permease subunit